MILNLKLANVSGNCQHQGNVKNLADFVDDPESPWGSPVPHRHTRSMGTPPPQPSPSGVWGSSTESGEPDDTPPKPKC